MVMTVLNDHGITRIPDRGDVNGTYFASSIVLFGKGRMSWVMIRTAITAITPTTTTTTGTATGGRRPVHKGAIRIIVVLMVTVVTSVTVVVVVVMLIVLTVHVAVIHRVFQGGKVRKGQIFGTPTLQMTGWLRLFATGALFQQRIDPYRWLLWRWGRSGW